MCLHICTFFPPSSFAWHLDRCFRRLILILLHPWGLKWILWGHCLIRSEGLSKESQSLFRKESVTNPFEKNPNNKTPRSACSDFCCQQRVSNCTAKMSWIFCFKIATDGNSYKVLELLETEVQPNSVTRQIAIMGHTLLTPHSAQLLIGGTFKPLGKMTRTILKKDGQCYWKHWWTMIKAVRTRKSCIFWQGKHTIFTQVAPHNSQTQGSTL